MKKKPTPVEGGILEQARQVNRDEKDLKRTGRGNTRREILMTAEESGDYDNKEVRQITKESKHPQWLENMRQLTYLQEHFADSDQESGIIQLALLKYLRTQPEARKEQAVIMPNFEYFKTTLDVVALYKNRVIEFVVLTSVVQLQTEMNKLIMSGVVAGRRIMPLKHHWLSQGKMAQSQVYFVVPEGFIKDIKALPPHIGVLEAKVLGTMEYLFTLIREAHAVHNKEITRDFTRSVLNEVYSRGLQLQAETNSRHLSAQQTGNR